ncbi:tRNA (5-methylaminomethyl-2-thiouridine)(34)-methyltransferase MnmD [Parvicella tangerina]|uniref:tRNA 5-methylaminomethyl-2-thiouridine biosynthesis bifunctional protein MnmC n=1 Tax=Parvicella tangerina TaxID=2829795 RepID=A0A916NH68_9FLAO|nr:tRNA (5-methylaminomethyl-2-thiouridine)(34)-methyltransferase MnmD [Parvicella tangerina]CAG5080898.1 tRNA 5-methylaminomethyl-2-thiouridine biosynthesis bifunctional protein MnmC [Parvicella tangerina]
MKVEILKSSDGSHTLYLPDIDETYHSRHGAVQEAMHVFIQNGLLFKANDQQEIKILEIGWGTGLNSLLTYKAVKEQGLRVYYTGIEKFPVPQEVLTQLNYKDWDEDNYLTKAYATDWGKSFQLYEHFTLEKVACDVIDLDFENEFDVVYFDAFGPRAQCEMWEKEVFEMIYKATKPGGVFVTYCAKGQVRRDLQEVGFTMEGLPGPPGKREMLRGVK